MSNFYSIIIGLFAFSGLLLSIWSWRNISEAKKSSNWPKIVGVITASSSSVESNDLMPHMEYSYIVDEKTYNGTLKLVSGDVHMPDYAKNHVEAHPIDSPIDVYYDPKNPEDSILEPGIRKDDWFLFCLSVGALVMGSGYLFFNV